jgi:ribose/xylose/arabinose/galactoside ABC-type transport system permease subunit
MAEQVAAPPRASRWTGPSLRGLSGKMGNAQAWLLVALVLLVTAVLKPNLLTGTNGQLVLSACGVLGLLTLGQTVVLLGGGIDLSVAANVRVASLLGASFMASSSGSLIGGIAVVLGVAVAVGLVNGLLIGVLKMPAFITTLGMLLVLDGAALTYSTSATGEAPESLINFYGGTVLGIPNPAVLLIACALLVAAALKLTVWGRSVYAVGGDPTLAQHAGIGLVRTRVSLYVVSGLLSGVAGLVLLSQAGVGDPSALQGFELQSITAAVVGGISLAGGRGAIVGALGGVAFLVVVSTFLSLIGVDTRYQVLAQGALILLALSSYRARDGAMGH